MAEVVGGKKINSKYDYLEVVKIMNSSLCANTSFIELVNMIHGSLLTFQLNSVVMFLGSQTC